MTLTPAQKAIVLADIQNDPTFNQLYIDSVFTEIADYYNTVADPAYIVWKTSVTRKEILQNGFDWTRLDNLSVGKARVWTEIFVDGTINPSKPNVRTGIDSVWVGTAQDLAVRAAVYGHCKRSATRIEKLLATGSGTDASPSTMAHESPIFYFDIQNLES